MLAWVSFKLVNVDITDERFWLSKGSKILNGKSEACVHYEHEQKYE